MDELIEKLKEQLIEALNLEIILLLDKEYGIKLKTPAEGKQVVYSVKTMADCIMANQNNF